MKSYCIIVFNVALNHTEYTCIPIGHNITVTPRGGFNVVVDRGQHWHYGWSVATLCYLLLTPADHGQH